MSGFVTNYINTARNAFETKANLYGPYSSDHKKNGYSTFYSEFEYISDWYGAQSSQPDCEPKHPSQIISAHSTTPEDVIPR